MVLYPNISNMKASGFRLILKFAMLSFSGIISAQGRNTVEMPVELSVEATANFDFAGSDKKITFIPGKGAEQIITPSTLDKTWINYSSIVEGNSTNTIWANLSSGNLPAEVIIKLNVGEDIGAGAGVMGRPISQIVLTPYPQAIITDIGSCFTGQGIHKGHQLTYSWEWLPPYIDNPAIGNIEIGVTYTLTSGE